MKVRVHVFQNSAPDGSKWSATCSHRFNPGKSATRIHSLLGRVSPTVAVHAVKKDTKLDFCTACRVVTVPAELCIQERVRVHCHLHLSTFWTRQLMRTVTSTKPNTSHASNHCEYIARNYVGFLYFDLTSSKRLSLAVRMSARFNCIMNKKTCSLPQPGSGFEDTCGQTALALQLRFETCEPSDTAGHAVHMHVAIYVSSPY